MLRFEIREGSGHLAHWIERTPAVCDWQWSVFKRKRPGRVCWASPGVTSKGARLPYGVKQRAAAPLFDLVDGAGGVSDPGLCWFRLGDYRGDGVLFEGVLEDFIERAHVGDLQVAENFWRKVCHGVGLVVRR